MANDSAFASRVFGLVFVGLVAYALVLILGPFLGPALWALLIAFVLFPVNRWLRGRLKGRRGLAALALTVGVILGIVIPATVVSIAFVRQGSELLVRLSSMADEYKIARLSDIVHVPIVDRVLHFLQDKFPVSAEDLQRWMVEGLSNAVQFLLAGGRRAFVGALGAMVSLGLTLFLVYFCFRDGDDLSARSIRLIPADEKLKARLVARISSVTRAVVAGTLVTALAQGAGVGVGFWICGLPSPVVFAVISAVFALLPVGGTAFVWVPGAALLGAQGRWGFAVFLAVWGALIVGSADNFLRPLLISGRAQISTLPVFFGVIGGLAAFGMIGMFLGPVLVALAIQLFRFAEEYRFGAGPERPRASD